MYIEKPDGRSPEGAVYIKFDIAQLQPCYQLIYIILSGCIGTCACAEL